MAEVVGQDVIENRVGNFRRTEYLEADRFRGFPFTAAGTAGALTADFADAVTMGTQAHHVGSEQPFDRFFGNDHDELSGSARFHLVIQ
jgi:hypothetical protein